jgi:NitT/TauT family transport system substrate-binding protein
LEGVEYVEAAPAEIPALMDRGDIDAYILWEPWPAQGVELGGHVIGTTGDFGSSYVHWLVATDSWLAEGDHADYAAAVTRALDEASRLIEADPELAATVTEEAASVPPEQTIQAVEQIDFAVRGFDDDDFASYERQNEYLLERGMIEAAPDLEVVIVRDFFDTAMG